MDHEADHLEERPGRGQGLGECYLLILSLKKKHALPRVEADRSIPQDEPTEETDEHN